MRLTLLQIEDQSYHFIWTFHHLLLDGWSMALVLQDVLKLYEGYIKHKAPFIPVTPQYVNYISWLKKQDMNKARQFWGKKLNGFENFCPFSEGDVFRKRNTYQDQYQDIWLSESCRDQLVNLTHKHEITLFSILQAAWILLINSKYGIEDIVVGNVVSGRPHNLKGAENIVGPFINTLPLRVKLKADEKVLTLIKNIQEEQLDMSSYAFTPLKDIQKQCRLGPNQQLFDSLVVFENYPLDQQIFSNEALGFTIKRFQIEEKSNFPLSLAIIPYEKQIILRLHYDSKIFLAEQIDRMLSQLQHLIYELGRDVTRTVDSVQLIPKDEREKTVLLSPSVEQHGTMKSDIPALHQQFEQQVQKNGDKVAIRANYGHLSYSQLNRQAEQIASILLKQGLVNEEPVAVLLNRSLESITAMIGIQKAGGVYVPLDVKLPPERLEYIIRDAGVKTLITEEPYVHKYTNQVKSLVNIHHLPKIDHSMLIEKPKVSATQLAYIMYTSGSTGLPKGVAVSHKAAVLHSRAFQQLFELVEQDVVLQFSAMTFDPSLEQIFPTLFCGGEVFIRGEDVWDAQRLIQMIEQYGITVANLPTAYFHEVVNSLVLAKKQNINLKTLRMLAIGGEKLSYKHVQHWLNLNKGKTQLYNFYGPTEAVTTSTYYPVSLSSAHAVHETVPIGIPIGSRRLYILDAYGRQVPPGEKGELCIGGDILARCYLNQPRITAEQFVPDPFNPEEGAVMYKTGDIVRLNEYGYIEYFGRNDDQVKIRGYRIELGEIERAFLTMEEVEEVAVIVSNQNSRSKMLVAYVVVPDHFNKTELKQKLKEKLPEYMIPKQIVYLKHLPLNTHGKIDRKALPPVEIESEGMEDSRVLVAPNTKTEKTLVEIWKNVLQNSKVGIKDNFFDLGGDSILALQIVAKAQEAGIKISTKDVFEYQTIEELSSSVNADVYHEIAATVMQNSETNRFVNTDGNIPLTPIQSWFFKQNFTHYHHWNQSVLLQVNAPLDIRGLIKALDETVELHDALKYRYHQKDRQWYQRKSAVVNHTYTFEEIRVNDYGTLEDQMKKEIRRAQSALNIHRGPMMKVLYFKHPQQSLDKLFITIHHLVVDGVSWRILLEDLLRFYNQAVESDQLVLPEKTSTFREWSHALYIYANQNSILDEKEYWSERAGIEFKIPVDFKELRNNTEGSKEKISFTLTSDETETLMSTLRATLGAKIHEVLLAAFIISLQKWSSVHQIKIDVEGHGRENIDPKLDLSRTVGWFTTLYPVAVKFTEDSSLLQKVQTVLRELRSIPRHGLGYGILKHIKRSLNNEVPSEVSFNYLGHIHTAKTTDALFTLLSASVEPLRHSKAKRAYLLDIEGGIFNGELKLNWMYSRNVHFESTIRNLMNECKHVLKECMEMGTNLTRYKYVPKDFPEESLTLEEWKLVNELDYDIEDIYTLSPVQEGMLFHSLLQPGTGVYVQQLAFRMKGKADIELFQQAWQHVIQQHPILRTSFKWEGFEKPIQVVKSNSDVEFEILDWVNTQYHSSDTLKSKLRQLCMNQRKSTVDITKDKPMHFTFVKLNHDEFFFIWTYHHLLLDGWSMPTVLNQVSLTYTKLLQNQPLPTLTTTPFRTFIYWYRRQDHSIAQRFWQQLMDGYIHTTYLPTAEHELSRTAISDNNMSHEELSEHLTSENLQRLKQLASSKRVTLNSLIQTAWIIFLHYISKKDDIVFGSVFSGRPASIKGIENMVGMFINTLPIRIKVNAEQKLHHLLQEAYAVQMNVKEFEHTSLVDIKKWAGIHTKGELFDTCVIYANFPNVMSTDGTEQLIEGGEVSDISTFEQTNYPLTLSIVENVTLSLDVNFNTNKMDRNRVERYLFLLKHILTNFEEMIDLTIVDVHKQLDKLNRKWSEGVRLKLREQNRDRLLRTTRKNMMARDQ